MESVLRAFFLYWILFLVFRIVGQRCLAQMTAFDLVLLLIIGEATQQALLGADFSMMNAFLVITTLLVTEAVMLKVKSRWERFDRILEGIPLMLIENGVLIKDRMREEQIDEGDLLEAARKSQGLESLDQIKYAVLERDGGLSIIPFSK